MELDFDRCTTAFLEYAECFIDDSKIENNHVQLKIDHSLRVLENAEVIVQHIPISEQTAETATLAALFHDIGRFPQYQKYRTFNDRRSVNHGHLGVKVMKKTEIFRQIPRGYRRHLLSAIALHNRNAIPHHVPEPLRTICDIVRDSDKLDIFRVMLKHFSSESPDSTVALEAIPHPTKYTQRMFDNVLQGRPCLYSDIYWTNDFKLILANWTYQLHFPISYRLFYDSGHFDQIFNLLPQTAEFLQLKEKLYTVIVEQTSVPDAGPAAGRN